MPRTETVSITSDLTGTETTYAKGSDPAPVNITVHGESGTVELTVPERDALMAFAKTGDPADLFAIIRPYLAAQVAKPARAKSKSKNPAAGSVDLPAVKNWLTINGHADGLREWAFANGHPTVEPGKTGRIPAAAYVDYAKHCGYVFPDPAPADATPAPESPAESPAESAPADATPAPETAPTAPRKPARAKAGASA
jgi:hypothetical protein